LICSLIVAFDFLKKSHICACVSHTVSSSSLTSMVIFQSLA